MTEPGKFYRVEFSTPVGDRSVFYFGSLSAIYEVFTPEQIGCKVTRLWNFGIVPGRPYVGTRCVVSQEELIRKKTKRGQKNGKV